MTAHPVHQASSPPGAAGWHWLHCAAEQAALDSGRVALAASPATQPIQGWTCFPRIALRTPGLEPGSISAARHFTTLTLERWGLAQREDDVAVVVSEMLTNALQHGLPQVPSHVDRPIRLGLMHAGPRIMAAVCDPSDQLPVARDPGWLAENGRGLHVIACLADRWGSCTTPGQSGKVVWATFTTV
jgi:hypothetical protein